MKTESSETLEIGDTAPDFELENIEGEKVGLEDLNNYDGVLVVFMCNHCPFVHANLDEIKRLNQEYSSIAVVGINPNAETHPMDTEEKMPEFVGENDIDFQYLSDPEQKVAEAFDAKCTPDPFLLDMRHRVYYHGRLTDIEKPGDEASEFYMEEAIEKMLKRKNPPQEQEPSVGCSIKWKESDEK
ncbi:thioredoxin family protein [Candidatus Nanosalina sp. VS9-1]|uniref:thioredoxin family protein n=1 Tax=Candidatus Nanosalina sp. VS9-1 TaxID=3388566 RepID=UPI0039DF3832